MGGHRWSRPSRRFSRANVRARRQPSAESVSRPSRPYLDSLSRLNITLGRPFEKVESRVESYAVSPPVFEKQARSGSTSRGKYQGYIKADLALNNLPAMHLDSCIRRATLPNMSHPFSFVGLEVVCRFKKNIPKSTPCCNPGSLYLMASELVSGEKNNSGRVGLIMSRNYRRM